MLRKYYKQLFEGGYTRSFSAVVVNLLLSFALYFLARVIYYLVNRSLFHFDSIGEVGDVLYGGLVFDLSAVGYTNFLYVVLMLLPLHYKERGGYQNVMRWIFLSFNFITLFINVADSVYYPFIKRRTTNTVFNEFGGDGGVFMIALDTAVSYWYLVLLFVALCYLLYRLSRRAQGALPTALNYKIYYPLQLLFLCSTVYVSIIAMRGGPGADTRPITISNATKYVDNPKHIALALNTPFSLIRTFDKGSFVDPRYFDAEQLAEIYTPIKPAADRGEARAKNVVIIILESFGSEYIGEMHRDPSRPSYTPFLDSLIRQSLTFESSFANGLQSIDAMPSILSSTPRFGEAFFLTPTSVNELSGLAGELRPLGYNTSFFHGARRGSMGFEAFANATKFERYYGREDFNDDSLFDGRWAIWDEEFLQYYASMLHTMQQPFLSTLFTASSHHPYKVPKRYEGVFDMGTIPIHQCVGYSDNALRLFFERISKEPWFDSTLFVLTADHTNITAYPDEHNTLNNFNIPIIFYQHNSDLKGRSEAIAQQIDIMPTVLGYLGYKSSFLAFGKDLLTTPADESWAVNWYDGTFQYFEGDMMLQFDGTKSVGLYNYKEDKLLRRNMLDSGIAQQPHMERRIKAIVQQYMGRMERDELIVR